MFGANNRYRNIPCEFRNFFSRLQKQFCFVVIVFEELLKVCRSNSNLSQKQEQHFL